MDFEIYKENLPNYMTWEEAVDACSKLGGGWRLPTLKELIELFVASQKKELEFGNYGCWSSTRYESDLVYSLGFLTGNKYINPKTNLNLVRPVRNSKIDKEYWGSDLPLPLSPSDADVLVFKKNMVEGTTLLLGCTKKLIDLSDFQMDSDPWFEGLGVIKQDWVANTTNYHNIIGDGVLNFTPDLAESILEMCSRHCQVFIARSFNKKLDTMNSRRLSFSLRILNYSS